MGRLVRRRISSTSSRPTFSPLASAKACLTGGDQQLGGNSLYRKVAQPSWTVGWPTHPRRRGPPETDEDCAPHASGGQTSLHFLEVARFPTPVDGDPRGIRLQPRLAWQRGAA